MNKAAKKITGVLLAGALGAAALAGCNTPMDGTQPLLTSAEIADISQPKPIIINAIFHPIPLSKTKINVYRANKLTGIAIPYNTK